MAGHLPLRPRSTFSLPVFLTPAFAKCRSVALLPSLSRPFSNSCSHGAAERSREKNKQRGVSAIRSTGPRVPLSVSKYKLPQPVLDPEQRRMSEFKTDPDHGLYGFFNENKETLLQSEEEGAHGRAWTYRELTAKSFEDLHALYWVGIKEMNQIATRDMERKRLRAGYGGLESGKRMQTVKLTNENIRKVLRDRQYAYEDVHILINKGYNIKDLLENDQDFEELENEIAEAREEAESRDKTLESAQLETPAALEQRARA